MKLYSQSELSRSLVKFLGLPQDICLGKMKCTIYANNELLVENAKCILEYSCETILLKGKNSGLMICGKHLLIAEYTKEFIRVYGKIGAIHFV